MTSYRGKSKISLIINDAVGSRRVSPTAGSSSGTMLRDTSFAITSASSRQNFPGRMNERRSVLPTIRQGCEMRCKGIKRVSAPPREKKRGTNPLKRSEKRRERERERQYRRYRWINRPIEKERGKGKSKARLAVRG